MERTSDDKMIFRVTDEWRVKVGDACMDRDTTISGLIRDALTFYLGFPIGFIEQMEKAAKESNTDVSTLISRLMLVYIASDKAIIDNFGLSKTYQRAFRFDDKGKLIDAEKLSDITFAEVDKVCKEVLKKMKWIATGKQSLLSKEEGSYVPVLQEAKSVPVARAKAAK
jgi:hypothetical protein